MKILKSAAAFVLACIICIAGVACGGKGEENNSGPAVESVTVEEADIMLLVGELYELKPTVLPADAADKKVTYSSGDPSIVSVDGFGMLTAVAKGETQVTIACAADSTVNTTVRVEVRLASETIEDSTFTAPAKTVYKLNEQPDYSGGTIEFTLRDGTSRKIDLRNEEVEKLGFDTSEVGQKTITVHYLNGEWKFGITVEEGRPFTAESLRDAEYLNSVRNENCQTPVVVQEEGEHQGVVVGVGQNIEFDIYTDLKEVYGVRMQVYSESDGVTFEVGLTLDNTAAGNPYQECTYASSWRGQYYTEEQPLHSVNDAKTSAKAGLFEGYAPLKIGYFGSDGIKVAESLSNGATLTLKLTALGAEGASVIFEEIEFLTEDDYPDPEYNDPGAPSQTWSSSLLTDADYVAQYVSSSDTGDFITEYEIVTDGLQMANSGYGVVFTAFPNTEAMGGNVYAVKMTVKAPAGTAFNLILQTRSGEIIQTSAEASWGGREYLTVPQEYDGLEYTVWVPIPDTNIGFSDTASSLLAILNQNRAIDLTIKATGTGTSVITELEFLTQDEYNGRQ